MKVLFIGGTNDGTRVDLGNHLPETFDMFMRGEAPKIISAYNGNGNTKNKERYSLAKFKEGDQTLFIYVADTMQAGTVFSRLLNGYKP